MKKLVILFILSITILFASNNVKGCDNMAFVKMWNGKKIASVNEDYIDEYKKKGYTTTAPTDSGSTAPSSGKSTVNYVEPEGPYPAIRGDAGGIGYSASRDVQGMVNQEPGYEGSYLDGYSSVKDMQKNYNTSIPDVDPYTKMMDEFRAEQERLAEAQRQSRISALRNAREGALSGLEGEKETIDPYYYDKRNQAAGQSDVGAMNFAQYMAGRGIKGSAGAMPEMYRNNALQGQIGRLDQQQAAEHSDIARRRSGIESAYEADVAGASADIDAQTMQNYINQMQTVQAQRIADMAAQGKTSTGELNLQGQNAQNAEYERQAALLAAQYYDDIQAKIDEMAEIDPNDPRIPYMYSARRQKIQSQAEQQASAMAAASEAEQQNWKNALALFERVGRITSPEQAQILGLPANATAADVDIARMNAATSRMNAGTAQTNAANSQAQNEANASTAKVKQYVSQIDQLFGVPSYNDDGQSTGKTYDPVQVKAYIQNLNQTQQISDTEARQLLALYNFTF